MRFLVVSAEEGIFSANPSTFKDTEFEKVLPVPQGSKKQFVNKLQAIIAEFMAHGGDKVKEKKSITFYGFNGSEEDFKSKNPPRHTGMKTFHVYDRTNLFSGAVMLTNTDMTDSAMGLIR